MDIFFKLLSVAGKAREAVRGKKTIISSVIGLLASGGAILTLLLSWGDGKINGQEFINQVQVPGAVFWASLTFLWAVFHHDNVLSDKQGNSPEVKL
jgi:hypothetical protein